ncbi:uncharacterized protein RSE6_11007 [Rhynchosporium secalis]|uniref:Uncharacterized protein n=1 Tax=Rhynchosporium secalis TaxID=38038 RepID=A0A1E1MLX4_RHYSE|nr:uncharacterized protein RSE6_11007 [Rhynchosporium secalis]
MSTPGHKDLQNIVSNHNAESEGKEIKVGDKPASGGVCTRSQIIHKKLLCAIQGLYNKYPDLKGIVREEIDAWRSESDEVAEKKDNSPDDDDGSDAEEREDKAEHGQHFDPVYSTSEDGGRPFDKKTGGGLLVTVSSSL